MSTDKDGGVSPVPQFCAVRCRRHGGYYKEGDSVVAGVSPAQPAGEPLFHMGARASRRTPTTNSILIPKTGDTPDESERGNGR